MSFVALNGRKLNKVLLYQRKILNILSRNLAEASRLVRRQKFRLDAGFRSVGRWRPEPSGLVESSGWRNGPTAAGTLIIHSRSRIHEKTDFVVRLLTLVDHRPGQVALTLILKVEVSPGINCTSTYCALFHSQCTLVQTS